MCFAGRPFECSSTLLLEVGYRVDDDREVIYGDFGLLVHSGYDAFGATIGIVGIEGAKEGSTGVVFGRYRRYLGRWGVAFDTSIGYAAGGLGGEFALGWADVLAVTAGMNNVELDDGRRETIVSTGIRLGSVGIGGIFYGLLLGSTGAR